MAYKIQELRDFSPASLRILNDNIRMLNLKIFGDVGLKDFNEPLRTEFNSKISEGNLSSLIEQNADSVKIAIDSTDGAGKVKTTCFEVTDEHAQYSSNDGSYVEFVPSQTGFKWHKQIGDQGKDYHYLSYSGSQYTGYIQSLEHKQYSVSLPDEFKGKDFIITVGIKELNGFSIPSFVQTVTAFAASIDYDNAIVVFECYGRAWELDSSNNPVACDLAISFTYTVVA